MEQQHSNGVKQVGEAVPSPHGFVVRPTLPDRDVNPATIEEAYVRFIFYCNPALQLDCDTESLRDAFRTPPRSGGKSFDTFTIYELVRKFYNKEIKTWTELTTTLGVEPPDPTKDESAQKVAQYGVRLKKWMNSMHVKAFFEYLMDIPNDYWMRIPTDPNPIASGVRDGVALEDDMALRALLPHIRPKRGRKRPEADDALASPAQRQRLSPASAAEDYRQGQSGPWSAHPDAHGSTSLDAQRAHNPASWGQNESLQTPVGRWPQSAVTPTTRGSFWDDALEPRSAAAPTKGKASNLRRGAKNVSSAWKTAGKDPGTRPRGRPPINRTPVEGAGQYHAHGWTPTNETQPEHSYYHRPVPAMHSEQPQRQPQQQQQQQQQQYHHQFPENHSGATPTGQQHDQHAPYEGGSRPSRPSISLQVPDRAGGSVRLATPPAPAPASAQAQAQAPAPAPAPPAASPPRPRQVQVNGSEPDGKVAGDDSKYQDGWRKFAREAADAYEQPDQSHGPASSSDFGDKDSDMPDYYFDRMDDRTNVDVLTAYFTRSMTEADWRDVDGNPAKTVSLEESAAMVHAMLQTMYKTATSPQAFLINLAALAGSTTLVTTRPKCTRLSESDGQFRYKCEWEYRFGHVKGGFTFEQVVPASMWAKTKRPPTPDEDRDQDQDQDQQQEGKFTKEYWQKKYEALTAELESRDRNLADLRDKVTKALGRDFM
ncbi:ARS binding protein Abp2, putative [Metarhizium acridum CQMa 102]|uniref:ARS binding protein Abp2, putative n=1 Tax=Metarhizium acridum (strain CQMa 102) TaxID=655827 RepID=E9DZ72_METAQ|nr:ARS binding protein Abp2, putative [Metarhizium acridum CQMa 102]EFY91034.1 ARS binding protein Abp2, putative [Metarhizium acridum CQMa 102]